MSAAEEAVRELDALDKEYDKIHDWMRHMRLGRQVESLDERPLLRRLSLRSWSFSASAEPLPAGMSGEFYGFLAERASDVARQCREARARLEAMAP